MRRLDGAGIGFEVLQVMVEQIETCVSSTFARAPTDASTRSAVTRTRSPAICSRVEAIIYVGARHLDNPSLTP